MKAFNIIFLLGAFSLLFMGCPYESIVPVDDMANAKVDKSLVGKYEERSSEEYTYEVKVEENMYRIIKKKKSGDDETTVYYGFVSSIGAAQYLNLYEETSSGNRKYYIYKLELKGGGERIKLYAVTDNITEEFATSADLRAYIQKYQDLSFFFDKSEEKVFYRE